MAFARFIGFAVVRAWQGFWRNAMMSLAATATVILMLVLLSGLFIVIGGLKSGLGVFASKVGGTARLQEGAPLETTCDLLEALHPKREQIPQPHWEARLPGQPVPLSS